MKNLKSRRGFSLVELMVVVAIMGVLAAIAIPAYNEYRKAAKKTAYKSDMLGLHKGWLAFGVELDSFCERETNPSNASIGNVGMQSLLSSKLYGKNSNAVNAVCNAGAGAGSCSANSGTASPTPTGCSLSDPTVPAGICTGCACSTSGTTVFTAYVPAVSGRATKHNFIGFGTDGCASANLTSRQIIGEVGGTASVADTACDLGISAYDMGVYGHISGNTYFGVSVNHNGVLSSEYEAAPTAPENADTECS